mgnify:CR=1 FL=1
MLSAKRSGSPGSGSPRHPVARVFGRGGRRGNSGARASGGDGRSSAPRVAARSDAEDATARLVDPCAPPRRPRPVEVRRRRPLDARPGPDRGRGTSPAGSARAAAGWRCAGRSIALASGSPPAARRCHGEGAGVLHRGAHHADSMSLTGVPRRVSATEALTSFCRSSWWRRRSRPAPKPGLESSAALAVALRRAAVLGLARASRQRLGLTLVGALASWRFTGARSLPCTLVGTPGQRERQGQDDRQRQDDGAAPAPEQQPAAVAATGVGRRAGVLGGGRGIVVHGCIDCMQATTASRPGCTSKTSAKPACRAPAPRCADESGQCARSGAIDTPVRASRRATASELLKSHACCAGAAQR